MSPDPRRADPLPAELVSAARRLDAAYLDPATASRLGHPEHRLVVYGTLRPGEPNHHLVAGLGRWEPAVVHGRIGDWEGYPILEWDPDGPPQAAALVTTERLPDVIDDLDRFEGPAYRRALVVAITDAGAVLAQCYVEGRPDASGAGIPKLKRDR